ncbi:helix-turn-helix domain-containing protein [Paenibacillus roseipurpureus]|uniref:helix-turn-helix domain-containing protein n=1 Tax=Paenibacillus roseopurpureus TaxID=2918901 RepID=UPI0037C8F00C
MFKEMSGKTPFQYLNELRMNAAVSYLHESDLSIEHIAMASGFSSIHYFSRLFKQKFGVSPTGWRKNPTR